MTPKEHLLMITVMTKQLQQIKVIVGMLKSRGVLQDDDAQAFESAVALDLESNASLFQDARKEYLKFSKHLGIETGLERP